RPRLQGLGLAEEHVRPSRVEKGLAVGAGQEDGLRQGTLPRLDGRQIDACPTRNRVGLTVRADPYMTGIDVLFKAWHVLPFASSLRHLDFGHSPTPPAPHSLGEL